MNIKDAIQKDFKLKVENVIPTDSGKVSTAFYAKMDGRDVIIKFTDRFNGYPKEVFLYNHLRHMQIELPNVVGYMEKPENVGYPCLIVTKIKGRSLNEIFRDTSLDPRIVLQMGVILKDIHKIKTTKYGYIDTKPEELEGNYSTLSEFYNKEYNFKDKFKYLLDNNLIFKDNFDELNSIYQSIIDGKDPTTVLVYNDFQPANIFSDGQVVTGLIDAGSAISCNPYHDLGLTMTYLTEERWENLLTGYGGNVQKEEAYAFASILCAYKTAHYHMNNLQVKTNQRLNRLNKLIRVLKTTT